MNQTPNYALNQWEASDRIQRTDFNADNAKIDAAISAAVTRFATGTYQGTGEYGAEHPNSLTFDFQPKLVFILSVYASGWGVLAILPYGVTQIQALSCDKYSDTEFVPWYLNWTGNTLSWYTTYQSSNTYSYRSQANDTTTYRYIAIG